MVWVLKYYNPVAFLWKEFYHFRFLNISTLGQRSGAASSGRSPHLTDQSLGFRPGISWLPNPMLFLLCLPPWTPRRLTSHTDACFKRCLPFPFRSGLACVNQSGGSQFPNQTNGTFSPVHLGLQVTQHELQWWRDVCGPGVVPPREGRADCPKQGGLHWALGGPGSAPALRAWAGHSAAVRSGSRSTTYTNSFHRDKCVSQDLGPVPGLWSQHLHLKQRDPEVMHILNMFNTDKGPKQDKASAAEFKESRFPQDPSTRRVWPEGLCPTQLIKSKDGYVQTGTVQGLYIMSLYWRSQKTVLASQRYLMEKGQFSKEVVALDIKKSLCISFTSQKGHWTNTEFLFMRLMLTKKNCVDNIYLFLWNRK